MLCKMTEYHRKFEHSTAEDLDSKSVARSGAGEFEKGDVVGRWLLIECKTSPQKSTKSYRFEVQDWNKIDRQAKAEGKIPAFAVGFEGLSLIAIETKDLGGFLERLEELELLRKKYRKALKKLHRSHSYLEDELDSAERKIKQVLKRAPSDSEINDSTRTVEMSNPKWTKCRGCSIRFTLDPTAAGWHQDCHWSKDWRCERCQRKWDHESTGITITKKQATLTLGHIDDVENDRYNPRYEMSLTFAQVKKKFKECDAIPEAERSEFQKLQFKFWNKLVTEMPKTLGSGWHGHTEFVPVLKDLFDVKPLPKLRPTVKV